MKRDEKLLYAILDLLEESPAAEVHGSVIADQITKVTESWTNEAVLHHLLLLADRHCAELVEGGYTNAREYWRITDAGHDLASKNPQRTLDTLTSLGRG